MSPRKILIPLVFLPALLLQACGGVDPQGAIQTGIAQTLEISLLQTAAAEAGSAQDGQPATGETPTPSDTPTATLSPTPSLPLVSVSQNTNCRTGPSASYGFVVLITSGEEHQVLATYPNANYVLIKSPLGSGDCWLWLEYANQTDFGSYNLPVATQPPTPTPTLTPTPAYAWDGAWNGYLDLDLGHPAPDFCSMSLTTTGNSISGTYDCGNPEGMGNLNGTISGSLSNNRQNASGTWSNSFGASGSFSWQIKSGNTNQFVGSYDNEFAWCGARASASQPSPCKWP